MTQPSISTASPTSSLKQNGTERFADTVARVALVDDDDLFRESLGMNLSDEGFEVVPFDRGHAALDYFADGGEAEPTAPAGVVGQVYRRGPLELKLEGSRAFWNSTRIDLTLTEFNIVKSMATKAGEDVSYRDIYDLVHGKDFVAGYGPAGYRAN